MQPDSSGVLFIFTGVREAWENDTGIRHKPRHRERLGNLRSVARARGIYQ